MSDLLAQPAVVASIISFAAVVITAILRSVVGETEADRLIKLGENAARTAQMVMRAAEFAVIEVEKSMKASGEMTNEELKETAVGIASNLLEQWGIVVSDELLVGLFSMVETAYQNAKKRNFTTV